VFVTTVIAAATSTETRQLAATRLSTYYAIQPPLETSHQRIALLRQALLSVATATAE